jgi:hypothetical protein
MPLCGFMVWEIPFRADEDVPSTIGMLEPNNQQKHDMCSIRLGSAHRWYTHMDDIADFPLRFCRLAMQCTPEHRGSSVPIVKPIYDGFMFVHETVIGREQTTFQREQVAGVCIMHTIFNDGVGKLPIRLLALLYTNCISGIPYKVIPFIGCELH